jgi:hypothetical protein
MIYAVKIGNKARTIHASSLDVLWRRIQIRLQNTPHVDPDDVVIQGTIWDTRNSY